jgi:hypothetical protein
MKFSFSFLPDKIRFFNSEVPEPRSTSAHPINLAFFLLSARTLSPFIQMYNKLISYIASHASYKLGDAHTQLSRFKGVLHTSFGLQRGKKKARAFRCSRASYWLCDSPKSRHGVINMDFFTQRDPFPVSFFAFFFKTCSACPLHRHFRIIQLSLF